MIARTVLLNCPIKAGIRAIDNQSDLRNFVLVMISHIIKETSNGLYFLVQLKEIKSSPAGYDHFFTACMYALFLRIRHNVVSEL